MPQHGSPREGDRRCRAVHSKLVSDFMMPMTYRCMIKNERRRWQQAVPLCSQFVNIRARFLRNIRCPSALIVLLSLLYICASGTVAWGANPDFTDPITERSWLEDVDGTLSPQQALAKSWTPFSRALTAGLTRSTIWVRLRIDPDLVGSPSFEGDRRLVLNMIPVHVDEIAVFEADRLDEPPIVMGDHYLQGGRKVFYQNTAIFERSRPFEVLLRIRTKASLAVYPTVTRWDEAGDHSWQMREALSGVVFTLVFIIVVSFLVWIDGRDRSVLLFSIQQMLGLLVWIFLHGLYQLSDIDWIRVAGDRITSVIIPVCAFAIAIFQAEFLKELGGRLTDVKIARRLALGFLIAATLCVFGWVNAGLKLHHILAVVYLAFLNMIAWRFTPSLRADQEPVPWLRKYIRIQYFLMALIPSFQFARVLIGFDPGIWTFWSYGAVLLISSILVGIVLLARFYGDKLTYASETMKLRLEHEHVAAQSDLITMLAHELKTPLSVISLALSSAKDQSDSVARARRNVESMRNILDHCENALLFDEDEFETSFSSDLHKVDICSLITEVAIGLADNRRINISSDEILPDCYTDSGMVSLVGKNLLDNALKYSPEDSLVTVSITHSSDPRKPCIRLSVANKIGGKGPPDPRFLFKKYYRAASARKKSGSGLGLYISQRMASRFGATITLRDLQGSIIFDVCIPLRPDV